MSSRSWSELAEIHLGRKTSRTEIADSNALDDQKMSTFTQAAAKDGRILADGCIKPALRPLMGIDGGYIKPLGRLPKGYSWDERRGLWVPKSPSVEAFSNAPENLNVRAGSIHKPDTAGTADATTRTTPPVLVSESTKKASREHRLTSDGSIRPAPSPLLQNDQYHAMPRETPPSGCVWDHARGVWSGNLQGALQKVNASKESIKDDSDSDSGSERVDFNSRPESEEDSFSTFTFKPSTFSSARKNWRSTQSTDGASPSDRYALRPRSNKNVNYREFQNDPDEEGNVTDSTMISYAAPSNKGSHKKAKASPGTLMSAMDVRIEPNAVKLNKRSHKKAKTSALMDDMDVIEETACRLATLAQPETTPTQTPTVRKAARDGRLTSDGCILPAEGAIRCLDGLYKQPRGEILAGFLWDGGRGLWTPEKEKGRDANVDKRRTSGGTGVKTPVKVVDGARRSILELLDAPMSERKSPATASSQRMSSDSNGRSQFQKNRKSSGSQSNQTRKSGIRLDSLAIVSDPQSVTHAPTSAQRFKEQKSTATQEAEPPKNDAAALPGSQSNQSKKSRIRLDSLAVVSDPQNVTHAPRSPQRTTTPNNDTQEPEPPKHATAALPGSQSNQSKKSAIRLDSLAVVSDPQNVAQASRSAQHSTKQDSSNMQEPESTQHATATLSVTGKKRRRRQSSKAKRVNVHGSAETQTVSRIDKPDEPALEHKTNKAKGTAASPVADKRSHRRYSVTKLINGHTSDETQTESSFEEPASERKTMKAKSTSRRMLTSSNIPARKRPTRQGKAKSATLYQTVEMSNNEPKSVQTDSSSAEDVSIQASNVKQQQEPTDDLRAANLDETLPQTNLGPNISDIKSVDGHAMQSKLSTDFDALPVLQARESVAAKTREQNTISTMQLSSSTGSEILPELQNRESAVSKEREQNPGDSFTASDDLPVLQAREYVAAKEREQNTNNTMQLNPSTGSEILSELQTRESAVSKERRHNTDDSSSLSVPNKPPTKKNIETLKESDVLDDPKRSPPENDHSSLSNQREACDSSKASAGTSKASSDTHSVPLDETEIQEPTVTPTFSPCGDCIACRARQNCRTCLSCKLMLSATALPGALCAKRICIDPVENISKESDMMLAQPSDDADNLLRSDSDTDEQSQADDALETGSQADSILESLPDRKDFIDDELSELSNGGSLRENGAEINRRVENFDRQMLLHLRSQQYEIAFPK